MGRMFLQNAKVTRDNVTCDEEASPWTVTFLLNASTNEKSIFYLHRVCATLLLISESMFSNLKISIVEMKPYLRFARYVLYDESANVGML
jgi:hypothetical protein